MAKDPVCGMDVHETSALKLKRSGQIHYFCSEHCLKKFAQAHQISKQEVATCLVPPKTRWFQNKIVLVVVILLLLVLLSYLVPILEPFRKTLWMYGRKIWWAVLLGFILGGILDHFVPREYISHFLAQPKKRTIFYAVSLGFFMSACSHGILAISIELHKKGASNPAVVAFLLASPWANLPLTIMLMSFFGLKALYIILSALVIAIVTGFIFQGLQTKGLIESNKNVTQTEEGFSVLQDLKARFSSSKLSWENITQDIKGVFFGSISLANMVLWWILIGMGLASLSATFIPQDVFQQYMGPTALGLAVTLLVATILEVCSEGTAPLAFEIYRQTQSLGNSFVFLMAGVVTDYTEIGLLWHNVGRKVAIWLPLVTVPQVVALGILANIIF